MDTLNEKKVLLGKTTRVYHKLQIFCYLTWSANVIFMIFGPVFLYEAGISVSGIFLFNIIVIIISSITSIILNKYSDQMKKRKGFFLFAYVLRSLSILMLAIGTNIYFFLLHYILMSLLNPLSFDVAIVYELGEKMDKLKQEVYKSPPKKNASTHYYLHYRLFGSLGWAITAVITGFGITALNSLELGLNYLHYNLIAYRIFLFASFIIYAIVTILFGFVYRESLYSSSFPKKTTLTRNEQENLINKKVWKKPKKKHFDFNLKRLKVIIKTSPAFILLLVTMFFYQAGANLFQIPYAVFLKNFSHGNLTLVGLSYFFSAIPEVPLFIVANRLIQRKNYQFTLLIAFLLEITRVFTTIAVIPLEVPRIIVPIQMMNSFSFRWPSLTHGISHELAPENKATGMNLDLIIEKFGGIVGSAIGSFISKSSPPEISVFQSL
ncbi:MAG: MFS transporter, partial [Promethearchaeota archaeon]